MNNSLLHSLSANTIIALLLVLLIGGLAGWIISHLVGRRHHDEMRAKLEGSRARALRKIRSIDAVNKQYENQILELQNANDALRGVPGEPAPSADPGIGAEKARLLRSWITVAASAEANAAQAQKALARQQLAVAAAIDSLAHAKQAQRRSDELAAQRVPTPTPHRSTGSAESTASLVGPPSGPPCAEATFERVVEVPVERIVEKIVRVPIESVVEKIVEVPVDRIVEKIIEVPVDRVVEKIVEVPVDRVVEKIVERIVWRDREVRVEVPFELPDGLTRQPVPAKTLSAKPSDAS